MIDATRSKGFIGIPRRLCAGGGYWIDGVVRMKSISILSIVGAALIGCSENNEQTDTITVAQTTEMRVQHFLRSAAKYPDSIIVEHCGGMRKSKNTSTTDTFCLFRGRDRSGARVRIGNTFFFHEDGKITQL